MLPRTTVDVFHNGSLAELVCLHRWSRDALRGPASHPWRCNAPRPSGKLVAGEWLTIIATALIETL